MGNYKVALLAATVSAALGACSSGGDSDTTSGKTTNPPVYYIYATDHQGNVTIYSDDGVATVQHVGDFLPRNCADAAVSLGEVHFTEHKALVVIQSGLKNNDCTADIGGGLAIVDLHTQMLDRLVALDREDGKLSRIVHTYMDPNGTHLWLNDDGATIPDQNGTPVADPTPDFVFRINIESNDTNGDGNDYLSINKIPVDDGHKKSAFSQPSDTLTTAGRYFATHNSRSRTISIIDNDSTSASFLGVVQTVSLAGNDFAHGMDFSPVSGHFYTGLTNGSTNAVYIIDATSASLPLATDNILANATDGTIPVPAAGYVHAHGDKVYTVGYVPGATATDAGHGYLTVIDASDGADVVAQVIDIGDVAASSFNISHMEMNHGTEMHVEMKVWIPSTSDGGLKNVVAVLTLDHMTGLVDTSVAEGTVRHVSIGDGGDHRNGKITPDGMHAYFPNGGDCGTSHDAHGANCYTISVIDTSTEAVIATVDTVGHEPGNIGIVSAAGIDAGSGGGGGGHVH